jgi:hypothetical protein
MRDNAVSTDGEQPSDIGVDRAEKPFPALLGCLVALLVLESAALLLLMVWLVVQASTAAASDVTSGLALLVIGALCTVWIVLTTVAAARRRSWMRASAITWHLLLLAVAVGCFTGATAVPQAGWVLLLIAVAGIALAVAPPVTRATTSATGTVPEAGSRGSDGRS